MQVFCRFFQKKYKKIVKAAKRALQKLCHTKVKVAFFGINKYLCDQGRSGYSACNVYAGIAIDLWPLDMKHCPSIFNTLYIITLCFQ